jgi:hypothetical protein
MNVRNGLFEKRCGRMRKHTISWAVPPTLNDPVYDVWDGWRFSVGCM